MSIEEGFDWATLHRSAYLHTAGPLRTVEATARPHGALRYTCPVNGSLILVTDEATLETVHRPLGRIRCIDCGEMHLLACHSESPSPKFVA
jgi:hypothetical protein